MATAATATSLAWIRLRRSGLVHSGPDSEPPRRQPSEHDPEQPERVHVAVAAPRVVEHLAALCLVADVAQRGVHRHPAEQVAAEQRGQASVLGELREGGTEMAPGGDEVGAGSARRRGREGIVMRP